MTQLSIKETDLRDLLNIMETGYEILGYNNKLIGEREKRQEYNRARDIHRETRGRWTEKRRQEWQSQKEEGLEKDTNEYIRKNWKAYGEEHFAQTIAMIDRYARKVFGKDIDDLLMLRGLNGLQYRLKNVFKTAFPNTRLEEKLTALKEKFSRLEEKY